MKRPVFNSRHRTELIKVIQHLEDTFPDGSLRCWTLHEYACMSDRDIIAAFKEANVHWQNEFSKNWPEEDAFSAVMSEIGSVTEFPIPVAV